MGNNKILFVDDEKAIRDLMQNVFTRKGYSVRVAESAEKALQILKEEKHHVMFLDLNLPNMNGIELCKKIKHENPMAIVYAITGYASMFELTDCREAGFDDYFTKPANMSVLLKAAEDGFEKIQRWKSR